MLGGLRIMPVPLVPGRCRPMRDIITIGGRHRVSFIGVAAVAGLIATLTVASFSDAANQEGIPPDEADAIKSILDTIERAVKEEDAAGIWPARRDAHAKAHGCVKADFSVKANIPVELRRGVFAATRSFSAWIRFSNGDGKLQDDHTRDGRG